jgi:hypothetical protein
MRATTLGEESMDTLAEFTLPRKLRRAVAKLARVILTEEVEDFGITDEVVNGVELFMRTIPKAMRVGLVAGLHTFNQSARAVPSSMGRSFASLPADKAEEHFERWWSSPLPPLHQLAKALRMFVTFAAYEHPAYKAKLGYDPDAWIAKVKQERLERFGKEIEANEALMLAPNPLGQGRKLPVASSEDH